MQRRKFMQQSVLAGAGLITAAAGKSNLNNEDDNKTFHLNYATHDGMFKNSAGDNFTDQIKFAYDMGFRAIEDNGFMDRPVDEQKKIGDTLAKLGMNMGAFGINFDHWPVKPSLTSGDKQWREQFWNACQEAVDAAKRCNA